MIKNIYIYYGPVSTLFPLLAYGKNQHDLLLEQGVYFPILKDFIVPYSSALDIHEQTWHEWLQDTLHDFYSEKNAKLATKENVEAIIFPNPKQCLDNLTNFLKDKTSIHTMYLCLDIFAHTEYCLSTLKMLATAFPKAQIHTKILLFSSDRVIEGMWLYLTHFLNVGPIDTFISRSYNEIYDVYHVENTSKIIQSHANEPEICRLANEHEVLNILLKDINSPLYVDDDCSTLFSSPKVLSFIQQFPKLRYPYGHPINWWQEKNFLQYGKDQNNTFSYLNLDQRNKIRIVYRYLSSFEFTCPSNDSFDEKVSNVNDSISPQEALHLASLITPSLRKQLITYIKIDEVPYEADTTRFVHGALLFVDKQIDESMWSKLQEEPKVPLIQNVYLYFSDVGTTCLLAEFCKRNKELLTKNALYFPQLKEILPEITEISSLFDTSVHTCFYQESSTFSSKQNKLHYLLSFKDRLFAKQNVYLAKNSDLNSICFFLKLTDSLSDIQEFVQRIQTIYHSAKLHIHCQFLSPDKQIENIWMQSLCQQHSSLSLAHWVQNTNKEDSVFHQGHDITQYLQEEFQNNVHISLVDSEDASLKNWLSSICLHDAAAQTLCKQRYLPSAQTFAFILCVLRMHARTIPIDWFSEDNFWNHEQEAHAFSYLRPYWKQLICDNFSKATGMDLTHLEHLEYNDISDIPLSISFAQASTLALLLSAQCRRQIVQNIDFERVKYKNQTARNVYSAVLLAENLISHEQAQELLLEVQGTILSPKPHITLGAELSAPKVTVLTMAYNHEKYITRCLDSVLAQQTNFPISHVVSDDFSTDGTRAILLEYSKKYPHIKLIFNEHNAPGTVACKLFDSIPSEYVALCDGDDYFYDPLKLQKQADLLDKNPNYGLCFHLVMTLYEHDSEIGKIYPPVEYLPRGVKDKYYLAELFKFNLIQTNSVMYRWRFQNKGLPAWYAYGTCPSDIYWHLIHAEMGPIGFINEIMSVYWRHGGGLFYETETNRINHRNIYGLQEITLYDILDTHFEGRYTQICHYLSKKVLDDIVESSKKTKYYNLLELALKACPALRKHVAGQEVT